MPEIALVCATRAAFHLDSEQETGLGGIEAANIALALALARLGHGVTLYSRTHARSERGGVANLPLEHLARAAVRAADIAISSNDARLLSTFSASARKIMWFHNPMSIEKALRRGQFVPMLRHRPIGVFVGQRLRKQTTALFPLSQRHTIGLGIDPMFQSATPGTKRRPHFVFASQRQRGLVALLNAWRRALPVLPADAEFHIFGTQAEEMGSDDRSAAAGRVVFHGRVLKVQLLKHYAQACAMLVPGADDETFCLAAAEAQAMGLPVVTMGIGSLTERVEDGVNGMICRSHAGMLDAASRLLADRGLWNRLSEGALAQRSLLTWDGIARIWEERIVQGAGAR